MFINKSWKYKYTFKPIWHEQRCEITYGRNIYFICKALFFFKVLAGTFSEKWTHSYVFVKAFNQEIKNTDFSKHVLSTT